MNNHSFRADLHCHSTCSDGSDSPEQLIHLAIELGLKGLSITDHDTIAAYETAIPLAKELNFPLLSGVEFSSSHREEPVHVLGYGFDLKSPFISEFCDRHQKRRRDRNAKILEKLRKHRIVISEDALYSRFHGTVGRPHIALLLVEQGVVTSVKEAFQKYLGEGKPAYYPGERITVEETIACIKSAGGKAILAHPHLLQRSTTIRDLLTMTFDGLEAYYAKMSPDQEKKWIEIAQEKQWILTGGSDYHGEVKPNIPLGASWVNQETFESLYEHFHSQSTV